VLVHLHADDRPCPQLDHGHSRDNPGVKPVIPELLLPAGSLDRMRAAYDFGADAVYAGQPRYSLRARNNEFRLEQLAEGIAEAHRRGKRFFVTSNLIAHNDKLRTYLRDLAPVVELRPDALIMADPGLIMLVREEMERGRWPQVPIHLSVQANTTNSAAVKFWQRAGVSRIILSRELSLEEIEQIRQACPDIELEVFVHGALCIAYSGRCLLSGYFNRRDPNQGTCTNACRWNYGTHAGHEGCDSGEVVPLPMRPEEAVERLAADFDFSAEQEQADAGFSACGGTPRHPLADRVYLLEETERRSGQLMPVMEDEHGTYILNSKDLRAVEHVARLVAIGVDSLKIEGRTKSRYYVARTAQVYRRAIDDAAAGRTLRPGPVAGAGRPGQPRLYPGFPGAPSVPGAAELRNGSLGCATQPVRRAGPAGARGRLGRGGDQEPLLSGGCAGGDPPTGQSTDPPRSDAGCRRPAPAGGPRQPAAGVGAAGFAGRRGLAGPSVLTSVPVTTADPGV
jgi:putative protease